jgi:steroid delta-isomerase-like uncharacterized protein
VHVSQSELIHLATEYSKAWGDRDVEAIIALHADDSTFQVHGIGSRSIGRNEIRAALEAFFNTWTRTRFEGRSRIVGDDHWVLEYTLHATLTGPLRVGAQTIAGTGQEVSFEGVDIVRVAYGHVTSKDSYIDAISVLAQLS